MEVESPNAYQRLRWDINQALIESGDRERYAITFFRLALFFSFHGIYNNNFLLRKINK